MTSTVDQKQGEQTILERGLATPLKKLRIQRGNPTFEDLAASAGISRNSVDNAINGRRQVTWPVLQKIVTALDGDKDEWLQRWTHTWEEIQTFRQRPTLDDRLEGAPQAALTIEIVNTQTPTREPEATTGKRARSRRRPVLASVTGLLLLSLSGSETIPTSRAEQAPDPAAITQIPGEPVYEQCSNRPRSILTAPGRSRGGRPAGELRPGEHFVLEERTQYWRSGYVENDPQRKGWVMAVYLCAVLPG